MGRPEHLVQPRARTQDREEPRAFRPARPGSVADEVARLERLGATVFEHRGHNTLMQDPEGNEFCVEPGPAGD